MKRPPMIIGGLLAIGLISIIIALALRNIKLGLLSLIPNLVPDVIGFGIVDDNTSIFSANISVLKMKRT